MPSARSAAAAPKRAVRAPSRARPRPRGVGARGPITRVRWDRVGRVSLLVVFAVVIGLYIQHTVSYLSTRAEADQQLSIVRGLAKSNAALVKQQAALENQATVELEARQLGMVKPGERPYVLIGH
jgi:cell division protein FtsB